MAIPPPQCLIPSQVVSEVPSKEQIKLKHMQGHRESRVWGGVSSWSPAGAGVPRAEGHASGAINTSGTEK